MANPFLFTEEELSPQSNDLNSNPFLMEVNDDETGDNPFLAQGVSNPFNDFGNDGGVPGTVATTLASEMAGFPIAVDTQPNLFMDSATTGEQKGKPENIDSAMSFFGTTITDQDEVEDSHVLSKSNAIDVQKDMLTEFDDHMGYDDYDQQEIHPPARPVPPSRTTQDLILSVSDQLDQTSSHLLDRIPVTRTPSPVSMRDLHSPSPTPDIDNLLDISDTINENHSMETSLMPNDNPFTMADEPEVQPVKVEPPRPPPPRPTPPRPTPPRRPSPPQVAVAPAATPQRPPPRPAPPQTETDLFDMFGSDLPAQPKQAPAPKSNQDILSLFSVAPASATAASLPETDLLSGDNLAGDLTSDFNIGGLPPVMLQQSHQQFPQTAPVEPFGVTKAPEDKSTADSSDTEAIDHISSISPVISEIQTSPPAEKDCMLEEDTVVSPEHSVVDSVTPVSVDHATLTIAPPTPDISDEQMDTTVDFGGGTPSPSVNPFASPEEDREVLPPAPVPIVDEVLSFTSAAPKTSDQFDAFAAKFDSVKKEETNNLLGGFGPPSRSVSAEFGNN